MFTSLTTAVAVFAAITTLGSASPIPEPQPQPVQNPCSPSFQGVETYIQAYNTYNRLWVPKGSQQNTIISTLRAGPTKWKIEGSGSPANDYTIKCVESVLLTTIVNY